MTKLKDSIQFYWDKYNKYKIEKLWNKDSYYAHGRVHAYMEILEEKIIDYYDGNSIDSENRAHAEMVLEILGVYNG